MANDRTLLAYQRTALGELAGAVATAALVKDHRLLGLLVAVLLITAGATVVLGLRSHRQVIDAMHAGRSMPISRTPQALGFLLLLGIIIAAIAVVGGVVSAR